MPAQAFEARVLETALAATVSVLPVMPPGAARTEEPEASGVAYGAGGHVVTALHVVKGAAAILVRNADAEIVEAELVGADPLTDIAVLEVAGPLPVLPLPVLPLAGDASLGEPVCAIGNAFGLGLTASCGVVSGVHMAGIGFNPVEDFVQTDAAINPGVSGGALVDREGRLVGLVSAIFTKTSDANIGVNFAVAAPLMKRVADAIIETGGFRPPRTGVRLGPWPPRGETGRMAAKVLAVEPGSPAAAAGLQSDDRILSAAGRRIRSPKDYISAVARLTPGDTIDLEAVRGGETVTTTLRLPDASAR